MAETQVGISSLGLCFQGPFYLVPIDIARGHYVGGVYEPSGTSSVVLSYSIALLMQHGYEIHGNNV